MAFKDKKNAIKYNNEYNARAYDRISVMLPKGKKEEIINKATETGESINSFVKRAIDLLLNDCDK